MVAVAPGTHFLLPHGRWVLLGLLDLDEPGSAVYARSKFLRINVPVLVMWIHLAARGLIAELANSTQGLRRGGKNVPTVSLLICAWSIFRVTNPVSMFTQLFLNRSD